MALKAHGEDKRRKFTVVLLMVDPWPALGCPGGTKRAVHHSTEEHPGVSPLAALWRGTRSILRFLAVQGKPVSLGVASWVFRGVTLYVCCHIRPMIRQHCPWVLASANDRSVL